MNTYNPASGKIYDENGNVVYLANLFNSLSNNNTSIINLLKTTLGQNGGLYVNDTNAHTPPSGKVIVAIIPLEEITLTTIGNIAMTAVTIPVTCPAVYGEYTSITLGSGSAIIYYGVN